MSIEDINIDIRTQEILLAASNHDLESLKPFLRVPGAASAQDVETGFTPLHAAIAACGPRSPESNVTATTESLQNGITDGPAGESKGGDEAEEEVDIEKAKAIVKELFLSGAIWNDLDTNDETPGCLAWRLGQRELYELVVEAGVRAELLMNLMGSYAPLPDDEEEDDDDDDPNNSNENTQEEQTSTPHNPDQQEPSPIPNSTIIAESNDVNSETYLKSTLFLSDNKLLDSSANGVMMAWEAPIMNQSASLLAPTPGLRVLNIGFGLGIIDSYFSATKPSVHHIIEAHPGILSRLSDAPPSPPLSNTHFHEFGPEWVRRGAGNHVIHEGKWQDICPKLVDEGVLFDVIYFDTFAESYGELKTFFAEFVVELLAPGGRFGFFNGLGADRRVCYDVYTRVVECDLLDAGLDVEWVDVDVDLQDVEKELGRDGEGEWKGVRRRYWTLNEYRLPVCRFLG